MTASRKEPTPSPDNALPRRAFGRTGLEVTPIGFGGRAVESGRHTGPVSEDQAATIFDAVIASGINFIDTSVDYGLSEERIGRYVSAHRDRFIIATKCGCPLDPKVLLNRPKSWRQKLRPLLGGTRAWQFLRDLAPRPPRRPRGIHVYTPENIVAGLDQSLRRLKTEYVDLLQFHGSPSKAQILEHGALDAVLDLKKQGKVRFIGVSAANPDLQDHIEMGVFDAFHIPYSIVDREHEDLITRAAETGAGIIIRGAIGAGDINIKGSRAWNIWRRAHLEDLLEGMTRPEFMLRFVQSHPHVSTNVIGTLNPDHCRANLAAMLKGPLPADLYEEAKARLDRAGSRPNHRSL